MDRALAAVENLSHAEAGVVLSLSHEAVRRYRAGNWKRLNAATQRKFRSFLEEQPVRESPSYADGIRFAVEKFQGVARELSSVLGEWGPEGTSVITTALRRTEKEVGRKYALPDPDVSPIQSAPGWRDEDYETVRRYAPADVALAAGTGTFAEQEPVAGEVKFRTSWLREHRLKAKDVFLVDVLGDSMERTIFDGDAALVDESRRSPLSGRVYALRAADGLLVKRLRKRDHRWWADSDNDSYEAQPLDDVAGILGRVVWWGHSDLSG